MDNTYTKHMQSQDGYKVCTNIPTPMVRGMPIPRMTPRAVLEKALALAATATGELGCGAGGRLDADTGLPVSKPGSGGCMSKSKGKSSVEKQRPSIHRFICEMGMLYGSAAGCIAHIDCQESCDSGKGCIALQLSG